MSVSIAQVRLEIGDRPRWASNPQGPPEVLSSRTDGQTSTFYLRFANVYGTTARVYIGTYVAGQPISWAQIAPDDATNPWTLSADPNGWPVVVFTSALPSAGKAVGTRYQFTGFTDTELSDAIANTPAHDTAQRSLWAVHMAMIPKILANKEAMTIQRNGEVVDDIALWAKAQSDLIVHLSAMLQPEDIGEPAYMGIGGYSASQYQP